MRLKRHFIGLITVTTLSTLSPSQIQAAPPVYQSAILDSNPAIYYQLNETTGPAINHGSLGSAFDATYFGTVGRGTPTFVGDAGATFDGDDDYLESNTAAPAGFTGNPTFTIEALVVMRCNGVALLYPTIFNWGQGANGAEVFFGPRSNEPNRLFTGFFGAGTMTTDPTPVGLFAHLVWVRQGGGNAVTGNLLYINGEPVALTNDPFVCCNTLIPNVQSSKFRINRTASSTRYFTGEIDEVALYDRAMPPSEVLDHYTMLVTRSNGKGDLNCDGYVDALDVDAFITASLDPAGYTTAYPLCDITDGDFTGDAIVNTSDVPMFVQRLLAPSATPFQQSILADNPQLFYQFNNGEVAINYGSLGHAYDAHALGTLQTVTSPSGDGAVVFTGVNDFFQSTATAPAQFTGNPTFSVEAVVFPTCTAFTYPPLLHWGVGGLGKEVYFSLQNSRSDRAYAGFYDAGLRTTNSIPAGQWVHLVWTRVGGGNSETGTILYVNGQPAALTPDIDLCCNPTIPAVTSTEFRINRARDLTRYFVGALDEVALYDYVLTPAQVQNHYQALGN